MIPTRQKLIGENKVEEYDMRFFAVIYINGKFVYETYDQAVARLERGERDDAFTNHRFSYC